MKFINKKEENNVLDEKPDLDTESVRVWVNKEEQDIPQEAKEGVPMSLEHEGETYDFMMTGFATVRNADTKKPLVMYKMKEDEQGGSFVLYESFPENAVDEEERQKIALARKTIELLAESRGIGLQRVSDFLEDTIKNELPTIKNIARQKSASSEEQKQ